MEHLNLWGVMRPWSEFPQATFTWVALSNSPRTSLLTPLAPHFKPPPSPNHTSQINYSWTIGSQNLLPAKYDFCISP